MSTTTGETDSRLQPFEGILPGEPKPYFLEAGEGEKSVVFDTLFTILLTGDETNGQYGVFTTDGPAGDMIPPHLHPAAHEIFYVIDGEVRLWMDDEKGFADDRVLTTGAFGFVPAGTIHAFKMQAPSRIFGISTGGFERFFHAIGTPTDDASVPTVPFIPTIETMVAAGKKYGTVFRPDFRFEE